MSRHTFAGKNGASEVAIGWDRPLATFFVQVLAPHPVLEGEDATILWKGTDFGELPTAASAIRLGQDYADLPDTLGATLETDRLRTVASRDGPAQIAVRRFLDR